MEGGRRFICASAVFPFGLPSHSNLLLQESFYHLKDSYVRDLWDDVFSSCKGSVGKLLVGHLLKDSSHLGEDVLGQ